MSGSVYHPSHHKYLACVKRTSGDKQIGMFWRMYLSEYRGWDCFFWQLILNEVFHNTATLDVLESSNFYGLRGEGKDYIKHKSYCECLGLKEKVCWRSVSVQIRSVLLKLTSWWSPLTEIWPSLWSSLRLCEPSSFDNLKIEDSLQE